MAAPAATHPPETHLEVCMLIALKSPAEGRFVGAEATGNPWPVADREAPTEAEAFELIDQDGRVSLRALRGGRTVRAERAGTRRLRVAGCVFDCVPVPALVALRTRTGGRFVCAEGGGTQPLVANRDSAAQWETFELVELGADQVALRALANGRYVSVDETGLLTASAADIGAAETFRRCTQGSGAGFALHSLSNDAFVRADPAGRAPLAAVSTRVGEAECFQAILVRAHAFSPLRHGLRFRSDGFSHELSGGMAYAALDYYFANQAVPAQTFRPAKGTTLYRHLLRRQEDAVAAHLDRWADADPAQPAELSRTLDRGIPCVLGLRGLNGGGRTVVAHAWSESPEGDVRIDVYDPRRPGEACTLAAHAARGAWHLAGADEEWASFFVDLRYTPQRPPVVRDPDLGADGLVQELVLEFSTGHDDLRGGTDNVDVQIELADGSRLDCRNVNLGARWAIGSNEWADVRLPRRLRREDLRGLTVRATLERERWDLAALNVNVLRDGRLERVASTGPHRFSAAARTLAVPLSG